MILFPDITTVSLIADGAFHSTPWDRWLTQAMNASFMVSTLPLDPAHSSKFDEVLFVSSSLTYRCYHVATAPKDTLRIILDRYPLAT